ncbi:hypothetical protein G6F35_017828 [Rhizopus arrhizus]|nr:hypothetical protein G6F35_017828 [Rhizopus arrhizus]
MPTRLGLTSLPFRRQRWPSTVPPKGTLRPAALLEVTLPGNSVIRDATLPGPRPPITNCPSGARTTPPCSTVAATNASKPNTESAAGGVAPVPWMRSTPLASVQLFCPPSTS